jgi:hypothetical protein
MAEIKLIDDAYARLAALLSMQAACVLLQCALPRHGHRQQQGVERWMVEASTHQAAGGQYNEGCIRG